jgi:T5orf172 domain
MGYLVAYAVLAFAAFLFLGQHKQLFPALLIAGGASIAILWWRDHRQKIEKAKQKAEQVRQRVQRVRDDFLGLNARIITDEDRRPLAFRSEFDARQRCTDGRWLYNSGQFYFVISSQKPSEESVTVVSAFLSEFYNIERLPTATKRSISVVEESQASKDDTARIERERELQRKRILEIALADIESRNKEDVQPKGSAVYVMASKLGVKIGISDDPDQRLGQVQTGHPVKVTLFKVIWFFTREEASFVERTVHDLLKLRGAHTSGEWFKTGEVAAESAVSKVVRELVQNGRIDTRFRDVRSNKRQADFEIMIAGYVSMKWNVSQRGNEWLRLGDKRITVFQKRGCWRYVYNDKFAAESFDSGKAAKAAALQAHFEKVSANPSRNAWRNQDSAG